MLVVSWFVAVILDAEEHFGIEVGQERAFIQDMLQVVMLLRLLRIFEFLSELEQWDFFSRAVNVMKGPFFNLVFSLYSLFFLYSLIGGEIYGGLIDTELFKLIDEINGDNTEIGPSYMWLNFNDFASGIITLFSMMLFNNW